MSLPIIAARVHLCDGKEGMSQAPVRIVMRNSTKQLKRKRVQYGALPYRRGERARPEVMLVTSRERRRWIIPKGWPKKGKSARRSAAREAFEEAGVIGSVARRSVGSFSYKKELRNGRVVLCKVRVFPLRVKRMVWCKVTQ